MDLKNRIALVTGGAHRVGKAIALALAGEGAHVAFTYNASAAPAETTAAEIRALGVRALALRCDQGDPAQVAGALAQIRAEFGPLDVLVNSASIFIQRDLMDVDLEEWDRVLNINLRGPFLFLQAAAREMLDGAGGAVVNIIDESVVRPEPAYTHHSVAKAGLWNLTQLAARRLAPKVRVNAVLPGAVLKPPDWDEERWQALIPHIPLRRAGSPQDVCEAVLYLLHAEFVTGQMVVVDGGSTL